VFSRLGSGWASGSGLAGGFQNGIRLGWWVLEWNQGRADGFQSGIKLGFLVLSMKRLGWWVTEWDKAGLVGSRVGSSWASGSRV
jgi:hypothetical protein